MNIISNATSLMSNVLSARAERIASDPDSQEELVPTPAYVTARDTQENAEYMAKLQKMREEAPRIDWENRTYKGKKIPDTWHKEPTPEMFSGEQPYSDPSFALSGEKVYINESLPERERGILQDTQYLQGMVSGMEQAEQVMQAYDAQKLASGKTPDPIAQLTLRMNRDGAAQDVQRALEEIVIGYSRLGIDLETADAKMSEFSLGELSLSDLLERFFG